MAAIDKDFPFPLRVLARFNPIPPKIHPKSGLKNEQINPAIANPFSSD